MMGGNWDYFPRGCLICCSLISSCIHNTMVTSFQFRNKGSFCGPDRFALSALPMQGTQKFKNYQTLPLSDLMFQWENDAIFCRSTVAPALNFKSMYPPVIPRISYKVIKMVIILSWSKLPFKFSQNLFLLKLLALIRFTFQCLKLTNDILKNIISNVMSGMYCIFWKLSDHMFSFSQKFKLE